MIPALAASLRYAATGALRAFWCSKKRGARARRQITNAIFIVRQGETMGLL
jgi:hypothetical protein